MNGVHSLVGSSVFICCTHRPVLNLLYFSMCTALVHGSAKWSDVMVSLQQFYRNHAYLKDLVRLVAGSANVLDRILVLGAEGGDLAAGLLEAGFRVGIYEPSEGRRIEILKKPMASHANFLGVFDPTSVDQFDVVCAFEVLGHMLEEDIDRDMKRLVSFLGSHGVVIGTVPLEENLLKDLCLCPGRACTFHRSQYQRSYNKVSIAKFLSKAGLSFCYSFVIDLSARLVFIASRVELDVKEAYLKIPQALEEALAEERRKNILPLEKNHLDLENSSSKIQKKYAKLLKQYQVLQERQSYYYYLQTIEATLKPHHLATLSRFPVFAQGLAFFLRQLSKVPGFSRSYLILEKIHRFVGAAWYNCLRPLKDERISQDIAISPPEHGSLLEPHPVSGAGKSGKPSVCLVISTLGAGGAERQVTYLAERLHSLGHEVRVRVASVGGVDGYYSKRLKKAGVDVRRFKWRAGLRNLKGLEKFGISSRLFAYIPLPLRQDVAALALELLEKPVDLVHCFLDHSSITAGWAGLISGTPAIRLSGRNLNPSYFAFYQAWMPDQYRWLLSSPRVSMENNSRAGADDYAKWLGINEDSIEVSYNGIDPDFAQTRDTAETASFKQKMGIPAGAKLVLSVCRASSEKCPLDLLSAFSEITANEPNTYCLHAGQGPMIADMAARLGALPKEQKDRIKLLGLRKDIPHLLSCADVFLLTSVQEGFPNVVMEAMQSKVPVVATMAGGTPELIRSDETGYLFEVGDTKGMADAVLKLLGSPELSQKIANAALQTISQFSAEAMAERVADSYNKQIKLLGDSTGRGLKANGLSLPNWLLAFGTFLSYARALWKLHFLPCLLDTSLQPAWDGVAQPVPLTDKLTRITLFTGTLSSGGAERQICLLARELKGAGYKVDVTTMYDQGRHGFRTTWLDSENIPHSGLNVECYPLVLSAALEFDRVKHLLKFVPKEIRPRVLALAAELKVDPPDVLHCYLDEANIIGAFAGLIANVPLIRMSARSSNPTNYNWCKPWFKAAYTLLLKHKRITLEANSLFAAQDYQAWLELDELPEVIPNGIDVPVLAASTDKAEMRSDLGLAQDAPVILSVLRLSSEKRPLDIPLVLADLIKVLPGAHSLIVGTGPLLEKLEEEIARQGLGDKLTLLGERTDIKEIMCASDLLLATSEIESFPNVILEAMAAGLPIVSTNAGGVRELFKHGECGFFSPIGDIQALAHSAGDILQDEQVRERMKRRGPAIVKERYSIARLGENVLNAYERQRKILG